MKKNLLILAVLAGTGATMFAGRWKHEIINTAPGTVDVELDLIGKGKDQDFTVGPHARTKTSTDSSISGVEVAGVDGPIAGMLVEVKTRGKKAAHHNWFIKWVDYKTATAGTEGAVNVTIGGQQVAVIPGTGRLEVKQV